MSTKAKHRATQGSAPEEQISRAAGRAAGYCWARNPDGPGRCTRAPHDSGGHKDYYARTEWK